MILAFKRFGWLPYGIRAGRQLSATHLGEAQVADKAHEDASEYRRHKRRVQDLEVFAHAIPTL